MQQQPMSDRRAKCDDTRLVVAVARECRSESVECRGDEVVAPIDEQTRETIGDERAVGAEARWMERRGGEKEDERKCKAMEGNRIVS